MPPFLSVSSISHRREQNIIPAFHRDAVQGRMGGGIGKPRATAEGVFANGGKSLSPGHAAQGNASVKARGGNGDKGRGQCHSVERCAIVKGLNPHRGQGVSKGHVGQTQTIHKGHIANGRHRGQIHGGIIKRKKRIEVI